MRWVLIVLMSSAAAAAEPLTLEKAVEIAQQYSPEILKAAADSGAASEARREARASRLPSFELHEVLTQTDSPADVFGLQLMQERFSFPAFVSSDPNKPSPLTNFTTEFQASLPVYTGGRLSAGIAQADRMTEAAQSVHRRTIEGVSFMTAGAYMDVLLADRFVELAHKARETTARHVDQAAAYFEAGMIVESDLLQARVQLAKMEETLISARNNASLARAGLNRVMGVELGKEYELSPDLPEVQPLATTFDQARATALESRHDLRAIQAKTEASSLGVKRTRGELLPEVALVGTYSFNDDTFLGTHGGSFKVMALARWNFWNFGKTQARVARARQEEAAAIQEARGYKEQVELELRQAWQHVDEARARFAVASTAVSSAEKALTILEARFEQGIAKVTDLLDAETMLNEARARELRARFDVQRSVRALNFAIGSEK